MRSIRSLIPFLLACGPALHACRAEEKTPVAAASRPLPRHQPAERPDGPTSLFRTPSSGQPAPAAQAEESAVESAQRIWGRADRDPDNDNQVAPPDAVPDCHERLAEKGMDFSPSQLPLKQVVREIPTCGCHDAVSVRKTPSGITLAPPAVMSCQLALALVGIDQLIQELSLEHLGEEVRTIHQGGTYSCRKMARFDLVSEHSYGNAIDIRAFTTESGKKVSVLSHYGPLDAPVDTLPERALFLRQLASGAYDGNLVSVSLSPYWDALHRDHFHFDMARYRVDGTRPR